MRSVISSYIVTVNSHLRRSRFALPGRHLRPLTPVEKKAAVNEEAHWILKNVICNLLSTQNMRVAVTLPK